MSVTIQGEKAESNGASSPADPHSWYSRWICASFVSTNSTRPTYDLKPEKKHNWLTYVWSFFSFIIISKMFTFRHVGVCNLEEVVFRLKPAHRAVHKRAPPPKVRSLAHLLVWLQFTSKPTYRFCSHPRGCNRRRGGCCRLFVRRRSFSSVSARAFLQGEGKLSGLLIRQFLQILEISDLNPDHLGCLAREIKQIPASERQVIRVVWPVQTKIVTEAPTRI